MSMSIRNTYRRRDIQEKRGEEARRETSAVFIFFCKCLTFNK